MSQVRKARISDIKYIHSSLNNFAKKGLTLPRSLNELYEHLRDFYIFEDDDSILGYSALHLIWEDIGEIRSLFVSDEARGHGIGKKLVKRCLKEAKHLGLKKVFALTYVPDFFKKIGFNDIEKSELPHKIWSDCLNCPKFPDCDEVAVIIGL
ncbi:MAG: N-acetyltransferase [Nitrospirota bacterium]|nr:MAG: N-acetyltransferase [Nitrospirota bacterium]